WHEPTTAAHLPSRRRARAAPRGFLRKSAVGRSSGQRDKQAEQGGSCCAHETISKMPVVSVRRGDEADNFVLLQLVHGIGEFALRDSGHCNVETPFGLRVGRLMVCN